MAKKTSTTQILRKIQKTAVKDKGRVTFGRRKRLLGKNPIDVYDGVTVLKKRKK